MNNLTGLGFELGIGSPHGDEFDRIQSLDMTEGEFIARVIEAVRRRAGPDDLEPRLAEALQFLNISLEVAYGIIYERYGGPVPPI